MGVIANGLANLTEQEMIELDGMLESQPRLLGLIVKAFPRQAQAIQYFLKTVNSGMEQGGMGGANAMQPGAQPVPQGGQPMQQMPGAMQQPRPAAPRPDTSALDQIRMR